MEKLQEQFDSDSESGSNSASGSCSKAKALPSFWEAYRLLGQCYEAEHARPVTPVTPSAPSGPRPLQLRLPREEMAPDSGVPGAVPAVPAIVGTASVPPIWRNQSFQESLGGNSDRLAPMTSSMSRRDSRPSLTMTAKAAEEAVARALGHRLQHVLTSADTTASHCVEMRDLPEDVDQAIFAPRAWWEPQSWNLSPIAPRQRTSFTVTLNLHSATGTAPRWLAALIVCPNAKRRAFWDAFSICCLLLELIFLPLSVFAVEWPCSQPTSVEIFLHVFWHLDILMTFITAIYCRGELVVAPKRIARNYAQGWLCFDVLYVVVNWASLLGSCSRHSQRSWLVLRFCQLALRLIRLCRLNQMTESIKNRLSSETLTAGSNILQITGQILLVHHLLACVWFVVGQLDENGWVAVYLKEPSVGYSYTTSLYWMFCQLGFGSTNIEPETTLERSFALMVAFMALGIFSTLLGTISATVLNLNKSMEEKRLHFRELKQFLSHHRISDELSLRVCRFLEHAWALKNEVVLESSVQILELLSTPPRRELRYARYESCLKELGFSAMTQQLSLQLHSKTLAAADTVFEAGSVAEEAYFLSEGSLTYTWGENKVSFSEKDKFGWLVEICIWTPWVHVGELSTRTVSNVEIMQIEPFFECICRSLDVLQLARSYAEDFVANMNSYAAVTDLWHPDQDIERSESLPPKVPKRNLFLSGDFGSVVPLQ